MLFPKQLLICGYKQPEIYLANGNLPFGIKDYFLRVSETDYLGGAVRITTVVDKPSEIPFLRSIDDCIAVNTKEVAGSNPVLLV